MAPLDEALEGGADAAAVSTKRCAYALLVPVWLLAIWLAAIAQDHVWRQGTELLLACIAATAVSLAAGIRLGAGFGRRDERQASGLTLLPVLVAWLALALPSHAGFAMLALVTAAQGAWDSLGAHRGELPEWYGSLRRWLTLWLVAAMLIAFFAST